MPDLNELWLVQLYKWVTKYIYIFVTNHISESCTTHMKWDHLWCWIWMSCDSYEWVMSHIWMSHVTHVTSVPESCHICDWVMSHIWLSHVTHQSHVTQTIESCTNHTPESHTTFMYVTQQGTHVYIYVCHELCIRVTHYIYVPVWRVTRRTIYMGHDPYIHRFELTYVVLRAVLHPGIYI